MLSKAELTKVIQLTILTNNFVQNTVIMKKKHFLFNHSYSAAVKIHWLSTTYFILATNLECYLLLL